MPETGNIVTLREFKLVYAVTGASCLGRKLRVILYFAGGNTFIVRSGFLHCRIVIWGSGMFFQRRRSLRRVVATVFLFESNNHSSFS